VGQHSARGNLKKVAIARKMRKRPTWQSQEFAIASEAKQSHLLLLSCPTAPFPGCFLSGLVSESPLRHCEEDAEASDVAISSFVFSGSIEGMLFNPLELKTLN